MTQWKRINKGKVAGTKFFINQLVVKRAELGERTPSVCSPFQRLRGRRKSGHLLSRRSVWEKERNAPDVFLQAFNQTPEI